MKRLLAGVAALAAVVGLAAPGSAAAGTLQVSGVTLDVTPNSFSATTPAAARIRFRIDTTYSDYTPPFTGRLTRMTSDLDEAFVISPDGFPQCDAATLAGTTTDQALAACGPAQVGSGDAVLAGPMAGMSAEGVIFNAAPAAGIPRVILHLRTSTPLDSTYVTTGTVQPSTLGVGYGQRLDIDVPILSGDFVFTDLDLTINRFEGPNGYYLTGRCAGRWLFDDGLYHDNGSNFFGSANVPCTVRPPRNDFVVGPQSGSTQNGSNLTLTVPEPGTVELVGTPVPVAGKSQAIAAAPKKKKKKKAKPQVLIAPSQATAAAAGTIALPLTLTRAGLQVLIRKGKVVSGVAITFTPTGGTPNTTNATVTIAGPKPKKKKPKKK